MSDKVSKTSELISCLPLDSLPYQGCIIVNFTTFWTWVTISASGDYLPMEWPQNNNLYKLIPGIKVFKGLLSLAILSYSANTAQRLHGPCFHTQNFIFIVDYYPSNLMTSKIISLI